MRLCRLTCLLAMCLLATSLSALPPVGRSLLIQPRSALVLDADTYIDANNLLGFMANDGLLFSDLDLMFGRTDGLYYPYQGTDKILSGELNKTVMYAAGLWLGGIVNGDTLVTLAEYSEEYGPGPMIGTSFDPTQFTNGQYRAYKLHSDSLAGNPNADYSSWPVSQGAPTDELGRPLMLGNQMLWTIYNDRNPDLHDNDAGSTAPLGIEVRQTMWANASGGSDSVFFPTAYGDTSSVSGMMALATIVDPLAVTGHEYFIEGRYDPSLGNVWKLVDKTTGVTLLDNRTSFRGDTTYTEIPGTHLTVSCPAGFSGFECVANAAGPLDPPVAGALGSLGFPTPLDGDGHATNPPITQQTTGQRWAIHTADNGGSGGGGNRASYDTFLTRTMRDGSNWESIGQSDFEIRFTGNSANPGVGGSYGFEAFGDGNVFWVPFELWDIGVATPDDPSDDYQMVPWILDDAGVEFEGDDMFALESWGSPTAGSGDLEHSASGGTDDPYTDWVYWARPTNTTPGTAGYDAAEALMLAGTYEGADEHEVMARMVFIALDAGTAPPFITTNGDTLLHPEQGSVFRILMQKRFQNPDTLSFTATIPTFVASGDESNVIHVKYNLYNKGGNNITGFYIAFWADPDLGSASDDLVGCDTLLDVYYCYNGNAIDAKYGARPPAVGVSIQQGPIVPSPGSTAVAFGDTIPDYRNLRAAAFAKYINGTDPTSYRETYQYMTGYEKRIPGGMVPYEYNGVVTNFQKSGDPVAGTGDLDDNPADRRMMVSVGPIDFAPGDSQQVIVKWGVGQGDDRLASVTALKEVLGNPYTPPSCCVGMRGNVNSAGIIDLVDLSFLIAYLTSVPALTLPCPEEADADGSGVVDLSDLTAIVIYMTAHPTPMLLQCP